MCHSEILRHALYLNIIFLFEIQTYAFWLTSDIDCNSKYAGQGRMNEFFDNETQM